MRVNTVMPRYMFGQLLNAMIFPIWPLLTLKIFATDMRDRPLQQSIRIALISPGVSFVDLRF